MKKYWQQLTLREKKIAKIVGGVTLAALFLFLLFIGIDAPAGGGNG